MRILTFGEVGCKERWRFRDMINCLELILYKYGTAVCRKLYFFEFLSGNYHTVKCCELLGLLVAHPRGHSIFSGFGFRFLLKEGFFVVG